MESSSGANSSHSNDSWTFQQEKDFEKAIVTYDQTTPNRWDKIAKTVGGKTAKEVKRHYELLVEDVNNTEKGLVPLPNYKNTSGGKKKHDKK